MTGLLSVIRDLAPLLAFALFVNIVCAVIFFFVDKNLRKTYIKYCSVVQGVLYAILVFTFLSLKFLLYVTTFISNIGLQPN